MTAVKILLVEDEEAIVDVVSQALRRHGFGVITAGDGDDALDMAMEAHPDLILLDLMLPRMDGWEVCRRLKESPDHRDIPIIMLTARREEKDVVEGLELGADDYIRKPFSLSELMARIRAILRRAGVSSESGGRMVEVGSLRIDGESEMAYIDGEELSLSLTEFRLLEMLAARPGRIFSRDELLSRIWGLSGGDTRTVDVHISRLRRKLRGGRLRAPAIETLRGRGYRLVQEERK